MARPIVSNIAERLYEVLTPLAYDDEANNWPLLNYSEASISTLQFVEDLIRDTDDGPGWSSVLDVDRAPYVGLPWLGQFVGLTTPAKLPGETDAAHAIRLRAYIAATGGFKRGTPASIVGAVQQYLSGSKEVILKERDTSPYHFEVHSRESETLIGNVPLIEAAIRVQKPAGLQFIYLRVPDWTYDDLDAAYATYDAIDADYATYDDIDNNTP
jgi:hypothetical protein